MSAANLADMNVDELLAEAAMAVEVARASGGKKRKVACNRLETVVHRILEHTVLGFPEPLTERASAHGR